MKSPRYQHNCTKCRFLGSYAPDSTRLTEALNDDQVFDLYVCGLPYVYSARWSSQEHDTVSCFEGDIYIDRTEPGDIYIDRTEPKLVKIAIYEAIQLNRAQVYEAIQLNRAQDKP